MSRTCTSQSGRPPGRPATGRAQTAAERMRRYRARQRAAGLRPVTRMQAVAGVVAEGRLKHHIIEARSLAMHCLAAQKIARQPKLLERVRKTLDTWLSRYGENAPRALREWQALLRRPWPEVAWFITDPGEDATRLRQSSPIAGVLSPGERERVYAAFRA